MLSSKCKLFAFVYYLHLVYNSLDMSTDFKQLLRGYKLKATPGRVRLLAFLSNAKKPMSIKEISKAVGSKTLDQATVYRTLESFKALGLVKQVDFQKDHAYYEMSDSDHHHLVCKNCGRVEDFHGCNSESLIKHALKQSKHFSSVKEHSLELFGLCKVCNN
ncbi:MAG TPA: transcriptional repressor [Patescibacteria group bacterium]